MFVEPGRVISRAVGSARRLAEPADVVDAVHRR
jgi:hypothetical protein